VIPNKDGNHPGSRGSPPQMSDPRNQSTVGDDCCHWRYTAYPGGQIADLSEVAVIIEMAQYDFWLFHARSADKVVAAGDDL
jgi:hypothetical protein